MNEWMNEWMNKKNDEWIINELSMNYQWTVDKIDE